MSETSWYSKGTSVKSIGDPLESLSLLDETRSWKVSVSSSLERQAKVAASIIVIFRASEVGVEISISGGTKESVVVGVQNDILLNAQSINGL